ncbi:YqaE/Pmp3 family membrane protein [Nostoc sp. BAE]|nr:YqaE/Pmp3 family membrane protein [Nostoc commune BAE]
MNLIRLLCAIFLPPLGVFLQVGFGIDFWINILLTLFSYIFGIIHAVWIIYKTQQPTFVRITIPTNPANSQSRSQIILHYLTILATILGIFLTVKKLFS